MLARELAACSLAADALRVPSDDGALLSLSMWCSSPKLAAIEQELQEHEQEQDVMPRCFHHP
jgi:hypothetical protein